MSRQGPAGERWMPAVCVCRALLAFTEAGSLEIHGRYRKAHRSEPSIAGCKTSLLKSRAPVTESRGGGERGGLLSYEVSGYLGDPWFAAPFSSWKSCCLGY